MSTFGPTTALVVVDVQNDFADPSGSLYVKGGEKVVPTVNGMVAEARDAGSPVIYTQDWHPESTRGHKRGRSQDRLTEGPSGQPPPLLPEACQT